MAGGVNQKLEIVPGEATEILGQGHMYINEKPLLSASIFSQKDQKYIPFFRVTEQPAMPKPFNLRSSDGPADMSMLDMITWTKNQQDEVEIEPSITLSASAPEELQTNSNMNNEIVLWQGGATLETRRVSNLSYTERKECWIIRRLARSKLNKWDVFYVHLKTDIQFRSLVKAQAFIVEGLLPGYRKKGDMHKNDVSLSMNGPRPRRVRGDKLLNRIRVGYYNHTTQEIFRNESPRAEDDHKTTDASIGDKRKQEAETSSKREEEVWITGDEAKELIYALYDFEPVI